MKYLFNLLSILFSVLITFAAETQTVFGPDSEATGNRLDSIVAVVNDDVITRSELDSALALVRQQIKQQGAELPPANVLERQVLDRLVLTQLQRRIVERNGIAVDGQTVNAALEDIAKRNKLTLSQLREEVEKDGISFAKFREDIRQEIALARLRQREIDNRIQISEQEIDNWLNRNRSAETASEYHIAQILIGLPEGASPEQIQQARDKALDTLTQLRDGADFRTLAVAASDGRQALEGGDLGWRNINQLPSLFAEVVPQLNPGEVSDLIRSPSGFHIVKLLEVRGAQQQMVNETKVRHILIKPNELISDEEARQRLTRLRERILSGEDFNEMARANSNDPVTATNGGELGWINPGELVRSFANAISQLEPGEISPPFQTRFGWHIAQLEERRLREGASAAQRAAAREALFKRKSDEEWEQWLRRLQDEAYVEIRL